MDFIKPILMSDIEIANNSSGLKNNCTNPVDTPFGYFGSKHRLAQRIAVSLPPHNAWVDAFCGSAAVTFAKKPAPIEVINDIDNEITNLFYQLRNHQNELCNLVALTPYARVELERARMAGNGVSDMERARIFLVSSMMAINGAFGQNRGGFSYSHSYTRQEKEARVNRWYNLPLRLNKVVDRLRVVRIENRDARDILKMYMNRPATLVYLDPPYLANRQNGYTNDEKSEVFHNDLLKMAIKAKCMILISGYENRLYNSRLKPQCGWRISRIGTHTRGTNGENHTRTEILWANQFYLKAEKLNKVPIRLSKIEKKLDKINPER